MSFHSGIKIGDFSTNTHTHKTYAHIQAFALPACAFVVGLVRLKLDYIISVRFDIDKNKIAIIQNVCLHPQHLRHSIARPHAT